jgi:hypothetical protein
MALRSGFLLYKFCGCMVDRFMFELGHAATTTELFAVRHSPLAAPGRSPVPGPVPRGHRRGRQGSVHEDRGPTR